MNSSEQWVYITNTTTTDYYTQDWTGYAERMLREVQEEENKGQNEDDQFVSINYNQTYLYYNIQFIKESYTVLHHITYKHDFYKFGHFIDWAKIYSSSSSSS